MTSLVRKWVWPTIFVLAAVAAMAAYWATPIGLLATSGFVPRWNGGAWTTLHGWAHVAADVAIWGAYVAIPVLMAILIRRRRDIAFPWMYWLFAVFILSCGTTHLVEAALFWWPVYRLSAVLKITTAIVSWATVIALVPLLPKVFSLPTQVSDIQQIIENAPTAMLVVDRRGKILMLNAQTEVLFGYQRADLMGLQVEKIVPRRVRPNHPDLVESYFQHPKVTQLGEGRELYGAHKDGHEIPVEIGLTPLALNGEPAVLACLVNQTVQKQRRERELSELSQVLSLGEVVGGLAHELNTPIQRIVTWAEVLQIQDPPESYREPLDGMVAAAGEAGDIVRRLRDAVIRRETSDEPIDLNDVIRATVTFMHREVTGVRLDLDENIPTLSGNLIQLQLVVSNLIRNAYQAGGPVTVRTRLENGQAVCSVDDCGGGFQVEPKRLFESFFTTKSSGLGMGLTITQAIVRRYGGRITASNVGSGARFEFTLPIR
ncbi:MAG: PAS domain S-box protein [Planctomycetales bacterium]|nr:PAS domain S-box protein [Planctomycetales bacterium]